MATSHLTALKTLTPSAIFTNIYSYFPVLGSASKGLYNVQFGSIDDNSAPTSTSSAAPSMLMNQQQVRTFGSISATPKPPTASASPIVTKLAVSLPSSSSTAPSSASPTVKKIDVHQLFRLPSGASSEPIPGQVPHSMGEQSVLAPMTQWQSHHYPFVSSITVKPLLIHPPSSTIIPPAISTQTYLHKTGRTNHRLTSHHILLLIH